VTDTPDSIAVASLKTHRLILTVPNDGPADIVSNMQPAAVANLLRYVADRYAPPKPPLTEAERKFLTFALDTTAEELSLGRGFNADDITAMAVLRKLAGGEQA
jgi:hypothetical protein